MKLLPPHWCQYISCEIWNRLQKTLSLCRGELQTVLPFSVSNPFISWKRQINSYQITLQNLSNHGLICVRTPRNSIENTQSFDADKKLKELTLAYNQNHIVNLSEFFLK